MFGTPVPGRTVGIDHSTGTWPPCPDRVGEVLVEFDLRHLDFLPVFVPLDLLFGGHGVFVSEYPCDLGWDDTLAESDVSKTMSKISRQTNVISVNTAKRRRMFIVDCTP